MDPLDHAFDQGMSYAKSANKDDASAIMLKFDSFVEEYNKKMDRLIVASANVCNILSSVDILADEYKELSEAIEGVSGLKVKGN